MPIPDGLTFKLRQSHVEAAGELAIDLCRLLHNPLLLAQGKRGELSRLLTENDSCSFPYLYSHRAIAEAIFTSILEKRGWQRSGSPSGSCYVYWRHPEKGLIICDGGYPSGAWEYWAEGAFAANELTVCTREAVMLFRKGMDTLIEVASAHAEGFCYIARVFQTGCLSSNDVVLYAFCCSQEATRLILCFQNMQW